MLARILQLLCPDRVRVAHINHQLQAPATQWASWLQQQCAQWQLPCVVHAVHVAAGNLEQEARRARYHSLFSIIHPSEVLVLGHHQQDQAETIFLRMMSGSGVVGLSAMKTHDQRNGVDFWRPWLNVTREEVTALAAVLCPDYIDDPANQDIRFDRVMLRQQIWPILKARWPGFQRGLARSASLMQDSAAILQDVLLVDWQQCVIKGTLHLEYFEWLSAPRQRLLLSRWMQGGEIYAPAYQLVERVRHELIAAREDAVAKIDWQDWQFRRYQGLLYRLPKQLVVAQDLEVAWSLEDGLLLASGRWQVKQQAWGLPKAVFGRPWLLKARQGGESLHLRGRVGHWPLKKSLQAAQIAPWQRDQVHVVWIDGKAWGVLTPQGFWPTAQAVWVEQGYLPVLNRFEQHNIDTAVPGSE